MNALCQMTGLNRAGFYRWRTPRQATPVEMELCDQMREVALEPAAYGYRRITSALQKRGFAVKHQFGISPSRISQLRRAYHDDWDRFCNTPLSIDDGRDRSPIAGLERKCEPY